MESFTLFYGAIYYIQESNKLNDIISPWFLQSIAFWYGMSDRICPNHSSTYHARQGHQQEIIDVSKFINLKEECCLDIGLNKMPKQMVGQKSQPRSLQLEKHC